MMSAISAVQRRRKRRRARSRGVGIAGGSTWSNRLGRPVPRHFEREHGGADDVESEPLQQRDEIDRSPVPRHQIGNQGPGGGRDMARQHAERARRKGRGDRPPLPMPFLALAQKQPLAEDRPQHPDRRRRAPVIVGILDQDVTDRVGAVEDDLAVAEHPVDHDLRRERLGRKGCQRIAAERCGQRPP
jgi:hypothetical protein